jgi:hypothetical protein
MVTQMPDRILPCCTGSYIQIKFHLGVVLARSRKKSAIKSMRIRRILIRRQQIGGGTLKGLTG